MSRYSIEHPESGETFIYGFDRMAPEYFAFVMLGEEFVVGNGFRGCSRAEFFERAEMHDFLELIPAKHLEAVALDLPF